MKKSNLIFATGILGIAACSQNDKTILKPNIILILADDMGYSDIGCFGSEISTPNLDKLAAEGMRMTQFYNAARSCPSRAALLTGLYPHQTGIGDMVSDLGLPGYRGFLNRNCVTIAEVLKQSGYTTLHSGKWHVGDNDSTMWPMQRGFDHGFSMLNGGGSYFTTKNYRIGDDEHIPMVNENEIFTTTDSNYYSTNAFTDSAISMIRKYSSIDKPFFLYLAYQAPHWPLHALPEDIAKYKGKYMNGWESVREQRFRKMKELGIIDNQSVLTPPHEKVSEWESLTQEEKETWDMRMAVYAAMIDRLDQNIGKLIETLKEKGQYENTIILFLSDNGGCHEDTHEFKWIKQKDGEIGTENSFDSYKYPWANVSNTPFRMFKHWVHEGGIATPFIAWYPSKIKAGSINRQMAHLTDIMPTCIDLANASYPLNYKEESITPIEGKSLLPLFFNNDGKLRDTLCWEHEGSRAVRCGKWKLVSRYEWGDTIVRPWELYDMEKDRVELNDLSASNIEKVKEMEGIYFEWANKIGVVPFIELKKQKK